MNNKSFKDSFLKLCKENKYEKNEQQLKIVEALSIFLTSKKSFFKSILKKRKKICFYLHGDVGVGKTMILNHYFEFLKIPKKRFHFNEFMIKFHDFRHKNKNNSIRSFVKSFKKIELIYLDEFQVTNIVDAMILGKLFETIFEENISVLASSNIKIDDLYKDGLQREQFLPFISLLKKKSYEKKLTIDDDYRKLVKNKLKRAFFPNNEQTSFKINQLFRKLTKNKKKDAIKLIIKGRKFVISNFYEGVAKFDFNELCNVNLGAEDFIKIANICKFIVIENIPSFNDENSNQQQRFITLIDILYEKKISLMLSSEKSIEKIGSSKKLTSTFKRTLSRIFELCSAV